AMVKVSQAREKDIEGDHGFNFAVYKAGYSKVPEFAGINVPDLDPFGMKASKLNIFKQTPSGDKYAGYTYCVAGITTVLGLATQEINRSSYSDQKPTMGPLKTQKQFLDAYKGNKFNDNPAKALVASGLAYAVTDPKQLHIGSVVQIGDHAAFVKENDPEKKQ